MFLRILILPKKLETKKCFCWYIFAPDSVCVCKSQKSSDKKKYMMIGLFYSVQLFYGGGEACRQRSFVHRVVSSSKR